MVVGIEMLLIIAIDRWDQLVNKSFESNFSLQENISAF